LRTDKHGFLNAERHYTKKHNPRQSLSREMLAAEQLRKDRAWEATLFVIRNLLPITVAKNPMFKDLKSPYNPWKVLDQIAIAIYRVLKDRLSQVKRIVIIEDG
jgi:hypothetical protein